MALTINDVLHGDLNYRHGITYTTISITHPKAFASLVDERKTLFYILKPCAVHCVNCIPTILYKNTLIDALANNQLFSGQFIVKLATSQQFKTKDAYLLTSRTLSAVSNLSPGSLSVVSIDSLFPIRIEHGLRR